MRKLLDLCCGGGLAGRGYWESGCFSEICGVDNNPDMKHVYPFDFICADMLTLTYDFLLQFDFIHASPPCQFYSYATPDWARGRHMRLIPGTHLMLKSTGLPHVIENVPGSALDLRPNLVLSGLDVGVPMKRPRYFHVFDEKSASWSSSNIGSPPFSHLIGEQNSQINIDEISQISCRADSQISHVDESHISGSQNTQIKTSVADNNYELSGCHSSNLRMSSAAHSQDVSISPGANLNVSAGAHFQELYNVHGDEYVSRDELIEAFGLRNLPVAHLRRLTTDHIKQGIPPAMTKHIALSLFPKLMIA